MADGQQTHEDIPEIPEGITLPDSTGSLIPDAGEPVAEDYSDIDEVPAPIDPDATEDETDETEEKEA